MFGGNFLHYLIAAAHLAAVQVYSCPKHFVENWYQELPDREQD